MTSLDSQSQCDQQKIQSEYRSPNYFKKKWYLFLLLGLALIALSVLVICLIKFKKKMASDINLKAKSNYIDDSYKSTNINCSSMNPLYIPNNAYSLNPNSTMAHLNMSSNGAKSPFATSVYNFNIKEKSHNIQNIVYHD